jgi:hypothetical protein
MQFNPRQGDRGCDRNPRELVDGVRIGCDKVRRLKALTDCETRGAFGLCFLSRNGEW